VIEPREEELKELLAYWEARRGMRPMPARADIDPVDIPSLLPYIVLVETAETLGDFRYRLCGTEFCRGFEGERTGVRFADLPRIENYDQVYEGYWRTYEEKAARYFHGQIVSPTRDFVKYSRLTLPLSTDGEWVDMILGGFVFFYDTVA
jgi:hypothetical protein